MKVYTFHVDPEVAGLAEAVAIREGFSWLAFLFDVLWLFYWRLWFWLLVVVVGSVMVSVHTSSQLRWSPRITVLWLRRFEISEEDAFCIGLNV